MWTSKLTKSAWLPRRFRGSSHALSTEIAKGDLSSNAAARDSDSERFIVSDLCELLEDYLTPKDVRLVYEAYLFGAKAHEGQTRASGEPYIYHPLSVARELAEMHMDRDTIIAAILHDVIEDTDFERTEVALRFGDGVAAMVDGVTKLTNLKFNSKEEAQAANFRKMMLAMSSDLRVIIVKLADRLHNMRTLGPLRPDKQRRISRETLEIYAPIAQRLGMRSIRRELERLGFQHLYPMRYRVLSESVKRSKGQRKELMSQVEATMTKRMKRQGIPARVTSREKNIWSIYRKMRDKHVHFNEIYDVFAVRITVEDIDACYRALGALHTLYKPVPGRFKDYIAIPKANGYQSLHTVLFGPHGIPIEAQIRTEAMDRVAETGIAGHWHYKAGDEHTSAAQRRAHEWLKSMMDLQQETGNALEFLESVKVDLFPDEVYVFTPKGEIMELPRGATGIDFAYAVHTDIGNSCVAVKINRRLAPLSTPLQNGNRVEVITAPNGRPRSAWLSYAATAKARHNIRHYLKQLKQHEAVEQGRLLLSKALSDSGQDLSMIEESRISEVVQRLGYQTLDDIYQEIGTGDRMASLVASELTTLESDEALHNKGKPLVIEGVQGAVLNFGKCCSPIPGDPIVGLMSSGRGMVIHRTKCSNIRRNDGVSDRSVSVVWAETTEGVFAANIRVLTISQRGVLAGIAKLISELQGDIANIDIIERDEVSTIINFTLDVRNRKHLAQIIRRLRGIPEVIKINRATS